jgi:hypothetical protein
MLGLAGTLFLSPADAPGQERRASAEEISASGKYIPTTPPDKPAQEPPSVEEANQKVEHLGGDKYRLGQVVLDRATRTVTIPVRVNMTSGVVEYVLVTEKGKTHESVFITAARPTDVHLAFLLLGVSELASENWPADHAGIPRAQQVRVEVTWPTNGPPKREPLARFVTQIDPSRGFKGGQALAEGAWLYGGSHFRGGSFAAEREGSIIAIIKDPAALVNGLRPGHQNDELHAVNEAALPHRVRNVQMVFTLASNAGDQGRGPE